MKNNSRKLIMMHKIFTENAPAPIGPYSQAIMIDKNLIFTSGQIPIDPRTGNIVEGDIKAQTRQVLKNIEAILIASGSSLTSVIKTTVYLKDINDFSAMNEVYEEFFRKIAPARTTVEVSRLPKDVRIEIEAIALVDGNAI